MSTAPRRAAVRRTGEGPEVIRSEAELEEVLTRPGARLVEFIRTVSSPLLILGAGGKMGPTLAVLARRAADEAGHRLEIIAVSRFGDEGARSWLEARGVRTVRCDLLRPDAVAALPDAENLVYLVGRKFGTREDPSATWAMNTLAPARVSERYPRSRLVALSTGNVYPLGEVNRGGAVETDPLTPLGEYANAAVARERMFEFCARNAGPTLPGVLPQPRPGSASGLVPPGKGLALAILRLFYAVEPRYGVLVDIARAVHAGEPVPLANGWFNCIWQGDANDLILRSLALAGSPPVVFNLCRPEAFSVREVAARLGELFGRPPLFAGSEAATALLGNAARICAALGPPVTPMETMLRRVADWVRQGGRDLGRPTHFEVRDGDY